MAILHMDTDYIREHGRSLRRTSTDMLDTADSLKYVSRRLKSSWEGDSSKEFRRDLDTLTHKITNHLQKLDKVSHRINQEVQEWEDADAVKGSFSDYFGNLNLSKNDAKRLFAGGYLATHLRWTPLRPNSMVFTGPNWMRDIVGIKPATRVIKPTTLVKQMALIAYIDNLIQGAKTGWETFTDPRYFGTDRALPAGFVDGLAKTAILAAGTTVLLGLTALISTISAPAIVVGGIIIGTWVVGGFLLDKFVQTPAWQAWQESELREKTIESVTRGVNKVKNFFTHQAQQGAERVKNVFQGFRQALLPA